MSLAAHFRDFARWCDDTSPLYASLSHSIAAADDVLSVAAAVPDDQPGPNNLFAAVHALVLRGTDHELRAFYPSVVGPEATTDPTESDPFPAFHDFVLTNEAAVRDLVATRRTQTNAVGRCSVLYPAFAHVAAAVDGPLALVDVGASAGLNLSFDRYRYEYELADGEALTVGIDDSPVTIPGEVRVGDPPLPADPPTVASRAGIDVNPLDVTDDADVNWLRALVWPEHTDRHEQLRDAVALAREDPPRIVEGNALDLLPTVVREIPAEYAVCIYDTQVLYQLTDAERERYRGVLSGIASSRDLHWVSGHQSVDVDGAPAIELRHAEVGTEGSDPTVIARYESHGRWLHWLG
ncbi:DUF2332 domain-containing protein [Haloarchaeobius sp. DFWS5]|uniref:DUF2332 domain-containing protein n=1 Tax=Haloarchaeobius sp. DFWS5 TaxID=3446114 RepID=UPI003EBC2E85